MKISARALTLVVLGDIQKVKRWEKQEEKIALKVSFPTTQLSHARFRNEFILSIKKQTLDICCERLLLRISRRENQGASTHEAFLLKNSSQSTDGHMTKDGGEF